MGDLVSPKRRDVFDRLRRRIEQYRRHQGSSQNRYTPCLNGIFDQSRQDTLLLHQRWRETKAKRAASKSKAKEQGGSGEARSQAAANKKRKSEVVSAPTEPTANLEGPFHFDEAGSPPNKAQCTGSGVRAPGPNQQQSQQQQQQQSQLDSHDLQNKVHSSVNIDIVQQINSQTDSSQLPQIKLTVSQTLQTGVGPQQPSASGVAHATTSITTNICKQEEEEDSNCNNANLKEFFEEINNLDDDVIDIILSKIEKDPCPIDFGDDSISSGSLTDDKEVIPDKTKGSVFGSGNSNKGSPNPAMYAEPVYDYEGSVNHSTNNMGCPGAAAITSYPRPPAGGAAPQPPILNVGDTGPAAETLKQMAAQHQHQHQSQEWNGMKGPMPPYGPEYIDNYSRRMPPGAYPGYHGQYHGMHGAGPNSMYPQYGQPPNHMNSMARERAPVPAQALPPGSKPGNPNLSYRGTKPLTHYDPATLAASQTSPSSLEQLQNQVQSHFSQTQGGQAQPSQGQPGHMQITQSQHMQMTHGNHRMQVSQTQHMQIHGNGMQPISVAQQQSFNMAQSGMMPQQQNQYMQMYQEKMRRQEMSYMNRPPPEYKVPPGGIPNNPNYAPSSGMGTNPLQTMQNMVNQTAGQGNTTPNGMYNVPMKSEIPAVQGGPGVQQGMTNIPQNANHGSPMSASPNPAQDVPGYPPSSRQQMIAGQTMPNHSSGSGSGPGPSPGPTRPMKPGTPVYTSTLMRNNRPPNVNVGPEGLNISQQRPQSAEWSRQMMASGPAAGQQQQMGQMARSPMPNAAMMAQYNNYGGQTAMSMAGPAGPRMAMSQQQAAMQQPGMHVNGQSMMMQQHQQLHMQNSHPMPNMSMSQSMSTSTASQQASSQGHPGSQGHPPGPGHPGQNHPSQGHPNQGHPGQGHPAQQGHPNQGQGQGHPGQNHPGQNHPGHGQNHPGQNQNHSAGPGGQQGGGQMNYPQGGASSNSEFPLDFLDNPQTNNSDFFDSMVPNSNNTDLLEEIFGK